MIWRLWAYTRLIATEAKARYHRKTTLPAPRTYEWLTLQGCVEHERRKRKESTP
jgi:hypothetical protein